MLNNYPKHCLFFDTETRWTTDPSDKAVQLHRLRLGVAWHVVFAGYKPRVVGELVFRSSEEFWGYAEPLADAVRELWFFCHNSCFDWQTAGLFGRIRDGHLLFDCPPAAVAYSDREKGTLTMDGLPFILRCWTRSGARIFGLDTLNWWRCTLAELGRTVGVAKGTMPPRRAGDARWISYCRQDVAVAVRAVAGQVDWCRREQLANFPVTLAGTAMEYWRCKHRPKNFHGHHDWDVRKLERSAYYGGRTSCWRQSPIAERVHELDVSSLYPSVMHDELYPTKLIGRKTDIVPAADWTADGLLACCGLARLDARKHQYPVRTSEGVWWAQGRFETFLCGPELLAAYQRGELVHVGERSQYRMGPIFKAYVVFWYARKLAASLAGDTLEEERCKLMLNSLYGKFGQRPPAWVYSHSDLSADPDLFECEIDLMNGRCEKTWRAGPLVFRPPTEPEVRKAVPAVAGWVTSYGRVKMDALRAVAGEGVWYQATDSLHCSAAAYARLLSAGKIAPAGLGVLVHKADHAGAHYRGPNYYRLGRKMKIGSVRRKATDATAKAQRVRGKDNWQQEHFEGLAAMFKRDGDELVRVRTVIKHMAGGHNRSVVLPDGCVIPPTLDAWGSVSPQDALRASVRS